MYTDGKIIVNVDLSNSDLTVVKSFEEVQENEAWYKLTDEQVAFQAENPEADITEVIACQLGKFTFEKAKILG